MMDGIIQAPWGGCGTFVRRPVGDRGDAAATAAGMGPVIRYPWDPPPGNDRFGNAGHGTRVYTFCQAQGGAACLPQAASGRRMRKHGTPGPPHGTLADGIGTLPLGETDGTVNSAREWGSRLP